MLYSKTLPLRGVGSSPLSGTLRLSTLDRGTRLEPMLRTNICGELNVYAVRAGSVHCAERRNGFYYVGIRGINGAIIVQNGHVIAAAFSGMSASERERAFAAVRMAEAKKIPSQQVPSSPPESRTAAQGEPSPQKGYDAGTFFEPKSDVARALVAQANRLFTPPDANADEFIPRPYVRDDAQVPQLTIDPIGKEAPVSCPPINARGAPNRGSAPQPQCRRDRCRTSGKQKSR